MLCSEQNGTALSDTMIWRVIHQFLLLFIIGEISAEDLYCTNVPSQSALTAQWAEIKVAFVFAGAARSFSFPIVHETIRRNLIHAFCAEGDRCVKDLFIRLSMADNMHVAGTNAEGIHIAGSAGDWPAVKRALEKLHPLPASFARQDMREGLCRLQHFQIGSSELAREKQSAPFAQTSSPTHDEHKIFRELDSRRYDMYYNRWAAFQMALKEERKHNATYDFFVHARLDALWGEPITRADKWDRSKLWVHDSWYSEVPDTFALMSRRWADSFWSLDDLVQKGAMCLGGPNFDPQTLDPSSIFETYGWTNTSREMELVRERECFAMFPSSLRNFDAARNRYWSQAGVSEKIMRRKLELASPVGIGFREETLGYTSLFMAITRSPFTVMCFYLHPQYVIGWIRHNNMGSTALMVGCMNLVDEFQLLSKDSFMAKAITSSPLIQEVRCSERTTFLGAPDLACHTHDMSGNDAWYFLPYMMKLTAKPQKSYQYAVRPSNGSGDVQETVFRLVSTCLTGAPWSTYDRAQGELEVTHAPCQQISREHDVLSWYTERQLLYFHPLRSDKQLIIYYARAGLTNAFHRMCLAPLSTHTRPAAGTPLRFRKCPNRVIRNKVVKDMLFYVATQGRDRDPLEQGGARMQKRFSGGSLVVMEWQDRRLCVDWSALALAECSTPRSKKAFAISAERTSAYGPSSAGGAVGVRNDSHKSLIASMKRMNQTIL